MNKTRHVELLQISENYSTKEDVSLIIFASFNATFQR